MAQGRDRARNEKDADKCWCEPGRDGKCWAQQRTERRQDAGNDGVHHILKGGEDSSAPWRRSSACTSTSARARSSAGSITSPTCGRSIRSSAASARRRSTSASAGAIVPNFRAIEDRLPNILDFFLSAEGRCHGPQRRRAKTSARRRIPTPDVHAHDDLVDDLEKQFGKGAVGRGSDVFAQNCARCHSSIPESGGGPFKTRDFHAIDDQAPRKSRADWMGNDQATLVIRSRNVPLPRTALEPHGGPRVAGVRLGDAACARAAVADISRSRTDGGRGYYRNISLLNVWAHAPFMHNNAIGPEICGKPSNKDNDFYRAPYVDARTASRSTSSRRCRRTIRAWTGASSCSSHPCRNC